jgi:hypothetical protein
MRRNTSTKTCIPAGRQWLMRIILATQEAEIRRIAVQSQPTQGNSKKKIHEKIQHTKKELVEWLKV